MEDRMNEMIIEQAKLVALTFAGDPEAETKLTKLEEEAAKKWPKEHKSIQRKALNLALGHKE